MKLVISIGGSILSKNLDAEIFKQYTSIIKEMAKYHKLVIVTGGGETARNYINVARDLGSNEVVCDNIGIEVTRLNAQLLICALGNDTCPYTPQNYKEAKEAFLLHNIVVMGGVIPGQTTDAVSAIVAEDIGADCLIIATSVDGVYSGDPNTDKNATKYDKISPKKLVDIVMATEMIAGSKSPVDPLASKMIERCNIKTFVIDGTNPSIFKHTIDIIVKSPDELNNLKDGTIITN